MKEYSDSEKDTTETGNDETRAMAKARARLLAGLLVAVAATIALQLGFDLGLVTGLGVSLFYVVLPAAAAAQVPLLPFVEAERLPMYRGSMVAIAAIGVAGVLFALVPDVGLEALRLRLIPVPTMLLWTGLMFAVGLGIMAVFEPIDRRVGGPGSSLVLALIPRTDEERSVFAQLSIAAGVGEEVAYRGYALGAVQALGLPPLWAVGASAVAFGSLHIYQGSVGVVRTGLIGLAFGCSVLVTGSLLPVIAAHAMVDVAAGLVIGPRLVERARGG